jgi:hypothetical protein
VSIRAALRRAFGRDGALRSPLSSRGLSNPLSLVECKKLEHLHVLDDT